MTRLKFTSGAIQTMFVKGFTPTTLRQAIAPMAYANWVIGTGVIEYPPGRHRPILSLIYAVGIIVNYGTLVYLAADKLLLFQQDDSTELVETVCKAIIFGNMGISLVAMMLGWLRSKKLMECIQRLAAVDESLENIGIPKKYLRTFISQICTLLGIGTFIMTFTSINYAWLLRSVERLEHRIAVAIILHYPAAVLSIVDLTFCNTMWNITERLQSLNNLLHGLARPDLRQDGVTHQLFQKSLKVSRINKETSGDSYDSKVRLRFVQLSRRIHRELCTVANDINKVYGPQILVSVIVSTVLIIGQLYAAYVTIGIVGKPVNYALVFSAICWCTLYSVKILKVSYAGAHATNTARKNGEFIHELHEPTATEELQQEIQDFSLQMIQSPLTFTACGFLTLDFTLVQRVIGTITTYLVIMIQMSGVHSRGSKIANLDNKIKD